MKELSALDTRKKPALKKRTGSSGFDRRPLTAFLAALAMYIFLGIVCRKYPFGDYSILISDLEAQYAPFLALYRGKLLSLGNGEGELISSLSYSFSMGLGKNFLGSFGYYLAQVKLLMDALGDVAVKTGETLFQGQEEKLLTSIGEGISAKVQDEADALDPEGVVLIKNAKEEYRPEPDSELSFEDSDFEK